jgi:hypothetical protein
MSSDHCQLTFLLVLGAPEHQQVVGADLKRAQRLALRHFLNGVALFRPLCAICKVKTDPLNREEYQAQLINSISISCIKILFNKDNTNNNRI